MINISDYLQGYRYIPIITGPTASGKSSLALDLCRADGAELVCADSMQIYRGLDIGTAKDTPEEMREINHHMCDIISPGTCYSVNDYIRDCTAAVMGILERGVLPVICGGTGQYISALCHGTSFGVDAAATARTDELADEYNRDGIDGIYQRLKECDPDAASKIHPNNTRRVIRALAVYEATGKTFTEKNSVSMVSGPVFPFRVFMINHDRSILYDRINRRVELMIDEGLEAEVSRLYSGTGIDHSSTCFQAIGYKEFADYFEGRMSLDEVKYDIKLRSRHYAKRQLTWFRGMGDEIILLEPVANDINVNNINSNISQSEQ